MKRWISVLAAAAVLVAAPQPVHAKPAPGPPDKAQADKTVTLITGDRVRLNGARVGGIDPARRDRPVPFTTYRQHGDWYVVPSDAARRIAAGTVDRQLFNVTGLVRQQYDDAHVAATPVIVEGKAPKAARTIAALNMSAVAVPKHSEFWKDLGTRRIWLNARVEATLDRSVPQVGAPAAWSAGYTGRGVTVAVLDSGYDTDHPDLAGRIGPTKNFTHEPDIEDRAGHGTHVASTVLGSGAASGGRYKGVAPDATLAVGKVLDRNAHGTLDTVLAAMAWAAAEVKAKVVNMSLGYGVSDGTDPASRAVNELSRRYGTLFVVSAGNSGANHTIGSPGAADAALTVASVTKDDTLSDFSSRGPRLYDHGPKPDLAAPGSDIMAARATGTLPQQPGDANYASLSGTSMASPHVAGAAALLVQQHPDWTGEQLKNALTSTAKSLTGTSPHEVGAGRLDLARAVTQKVTASPSSLHTYFAWPTAGAPAQRRVLTYRNPGTAPVTLNLALALKDLDGTSAPAGTATLQPATLTVPAGGEATATLSVAAPTGRTGTYVGVVAATGGAVTVRTPVAVYHEPELYDLNVRVRDRAGADLPYGEFAGTLTDLGTGEVRYLEAGKRLRLPKARYAVMATVATPGGGYDNTISSLAHLGFTLDRPTNIDLDARTAKPVRASVEAAGATGGSHLSTMIIDTPNGRVQSGIQIDRRHSRLYAAAIGSSDDFRFTNEINAEEPLVDLVAESPEQLPVSARWHHESPRWRGSETLGAAHGGQGRPQDLTDVRGKLVLLDLQADAVLAERVANVAAAGGSKVLYRQEEGGGEGLTRQALALPTLHGDDATADRLRELAGKGPVTVRLTARDSSRHRYELGYVEHGKLPATMDYAPRDKDLAAVPTRYYGSVERSVDAFFDLDGHRFDGLWPTVAGPATERTEYFTPGRWTLSAVAGDGVDVLRVDRQDLAAGPAPRLDWNKAVFGPAFQDFYQAYRVDDTIALYAPLYTDAAGHPRWANTDTDTGSTSLYRDGTLVKTVDTPGTGEFAVPAGAATYRLTAESRRAQPWWPLATRTSTAWTFRSARPDGLVGLPLLVPRFDPQVNLANRMPCRLVTVIPMRVEALHEAAITNVTVDVSHDDGATWRPAAVSGTGSERTVRIWHAKRKAFASLRTTATDAAGNKVEQTIIRAYEIC